ncbi:dihydrofolate reductase [Sporosarcina sp. HYO08]|uniref:dihydrofolate reductase n=1 Tax=Sporosarcina sp. HYO08 TaxID=1759557 RepID=UPI0007925778|nr:dihydrofolate reductase [Sporosarcina sp. HYO08]KXH82085.1 dihydrofolate reductase [Sporosarcina sp. HYO08]
MISLLVAHDTDRVIGRNNDLPWYIPEDLAYFKKMTMGKAMVMGRKTFDSIGRPLPGRQSIIVTRNPDYTAEGAIVVRDLSEAIEKAKAYGDEVMVIGGAEIFRQSMDIADRLYITYIDKQFEGDTFFPEYDSEWKVVSSSETHVTDDQIPYQFLIYERIV